MAKPLMEYRADVNVRDNYGQTPWDKAVCAGYKGLALLLAAAGGPLRAQE